MNPHPLTGIDVPIPVAVAVESVLAAGHEVTVNRAALRTDLPRNAMCGVWSSHGRDFPIAFGTCVIVIEGPGVEMFEARLRDVGFLGYPADDGRPAVFFYTTTLKVIR